MNDQRSANRTPRAERVVAAAERLRDEPHHVTFHETGWELEHDLSCRVRGMRHCPIDKELKSLAGPPSVGMGRFAVHFQYGGLVYSTAHGEDAAKELMEALDG